MGLKNIIKERFLPVDANRFAKKTYYNGLLNNAIAKTAAAAATRMIDPRKPETWEFSGFSQNGEDGIIDYLLTGIKNKNKYFIEIGSGNGLENTTGYLAHIKKYSGLQVEGDEEAYAESLLINPWLIHLIKSFVNATTVTDIIGKSTCNDPDVFSLDIDGMDYYILKEFLGQGLRPKIIIVEYNSAFGPGNSLTLPYDPAFNMFKSSIPYLYYGVSIKGWNNLLSEYGYEFLTVETNGINAFFVNKNEFKNGFLSEVEPIEFKENVHQMRMFRTPWVGQFEMIKGLPLHKI